MTLPSLLSDHEQRAFSDFLTQLNHDEQNHAARMNSGAPQQQPMIDPSISQAQLQQHLYLRHLQQQQQQHHSSSLDHGIGGGPGGPVGGVFGVPFQSTDTPLAPAHSTPSLEDQQREWMQHLSSNPLLAPGGVIDPHAMSQAFLQNPQLMAQANAISQAMMIAQHQQQMLQHQQQHREQEQQRRQHEQQQQQQQRQHYQHSDDHRYQQQHNQNNYQQQQHGSYHGGSASPGEGPGQFSGRDQQHHSPPQEYHQHSHHQQQQQQHSSASLSSSNSNLTRSLPKQKSKSNLHNGYANNTPSSSFDPTTTPHYPASPNDTASHQQQYTRTFDNDDRGNDSEPSPPPSKKAARRKESTGASSSPYDSSTPFSSLKTKSAHRSSRDGHDPVRPSGSRKSSSASSFPAHNNGGVYKRESLDEHASLYLRQNPVAGTAGLNSEDEGGDYGEHQQHDDHSSSPRSAKAPRLSPPDGATPTTSTTTKTSGKKAPHELLTEAEKKANHIASEQKRRQNIRVGFDCLVEIVPTLSECHRSEALILQKSVDYIHRLLSQKNELESKVRDLQVNLGEPTEEQFFDHSDYSDTEMDARD